MCTCVFVLHSNGSALQYGRNSSCQTKEVIAFHANNIILITWNCANDHLHLTVGIVSDSLTPHTFFNGIGLDGFCIFKVLEKQRTSIYKRKNGGSPIHHVPVLHAPQCNVETAVLHMPRHHANGKSISYWSCLVYFVYWEICFCKTKFIYVKTWKQVNCTREMCCAAVAVALWGSGVGVSVL